MDAALSTFLERVRPEAQPTVTALNDALRRSAELETAIKWGKLTYATPGDFHHWICAISVGKKQVTLTFHFGGLLPDPDSIFRAGSSTFLRMLDFDSPTSVDSAVIARTIGDALGRLDYFRANWKAISAGELPPRSEDRAPTGPTNTSA